MKYIYLSLLVLLTGFSLYNHVRLDSKNYIIEEYDKLVSEMKSNSQNYLASLCKESNQYSDSLFLLATSDTTRIQDINKPCLLFYFEPNDCMTCIEENIFTLINLSKNNSSLNIYILSTMEKMYYLKLLLKTHNIESIHYGCFIDSAMIKKRTSYSLRLPSGKLSNSYYPAKGNVKSTKRYLETVEKVFEEAETYE